MLIFHTRPIEILVLFPTEPYDIASKRTNSSLIDRFQPNAILVWYDTGTDLNATRKNRGYVDVFRIKCCHGPPKITHKLLFFDILQVQKCSFLRAACRTLTFTTQKSLNVVPYYYDKGREWVGEWVIVV